jgi:hypothetical protein
MNIRRRLAQLEHRVSKHPLATDVTIWLPYKGPGYGPEPGRYPSPNGGTLVIYVPEEAPTAAGGVSDEPSPET